MDKLSSFNVPQHFAERENLLSDFSDSASKRFFVLFLYKLFV